MNNKIKFIFKILFKWIIIENLFLKYDLNE